jgi:hypothetical protein
MQSRYNKSNTSSLPFSSSGPSAINLYTNKTPSIKSNATSGYVSETSNTYSSEYNKANDHYSSPSSALNSLPGYVSDFGSSHLSKGSYHQTNTYGSSPGVKTYSYPFSSPAMSRNLSTNCSRIPSVTSSYSSGYMRSNSREDIKLQLPSKSPSTPRYISYTRSSRANYSSNTSSLNNNNSGNNSKTNKNIDETKVKNKAPADFTSDSEDENTDIETKMISHTNIISISRSTSPKRETQTDSTNDSISSTQQIIRPKKIVFGVSIKKTTQQTQVNEMDLKEALSPSLSPCLTPSLTPSPSHSPSPVRMRYGCTPNKRNNNNSNFNRYSMPTIRSTNYSTNYSNFSSNTSQSNQIENRISPQPLSSCDKQSDIKETSINNMSSDNQNANKDKKLEELCNNYNSAKNDEYDSYSNNNNNNNTPKSDSKSSLQSRRDSHSSARISPHIIRRRRSLSRNKLSGRSRSSSKEKLLDREESSTTSTSDSSEDEDEKKKSVADRHSRIKRKKKLQANELISNDNKVIYKGSFDGINQLKPTHLDSLPTRSVSAEPLKSFDENNQKKSSTNESSSSPEKVIIRKPSVNIQKTEPLIVVKKLPLKIKDPYSTASECDESEFISESEAEKFSSSMPVVTIRLSQSSTEDQSKQSDETSSETTDDCTKICDNLNKSETKIQKSPTVIEVNLDKNKNSTQKSSTLTEVIAKNDEKAKYESSPDNETDDLSDFDDKSLHSFQEKQAFIAPFPKEDDEISFKQLNSKDTSLRDSGFSEASTRPDSPYDNIKTAADSLNIVSYENIYETNNCCSKEIIPAPQQFVSKVNDIDSLLSGYKEETFEEFERKFQTENKHPVKYLKDDARKNLSLFISKCQDIDEMIGPTSPMSPNLFSNFSSSSLSKLIEEIGEDDDSVAIDASAVKVHNAKAMKSTVILFILYFFFRNIKSNFSLRSRLTLKKLIRVQYEFGKTKHSLFICLK